MGSCKVSYLVAYDTYLEGSKNESLQFSDSIINVVFDPRPNGVIFDIENITKNNLFLIWDKSYFIEPDGNSSKLLNRDILETNSAIRDKENYESIIPQNGHFKRFTASATKISEFEIYNSNTFFNEVFKTIQTNMGYSKYYLTGSYWYTGTERPNGTPSEISAVDKQIIRIVQNFIPKNNKLGLGFTIRNKDQESEYHFKIPIKRATISKKKSGQPMYTKSYELHKDNGFNPIPIE